jgi:probable rRNA maturation factor
MDAPSFTLSVQYAVAPRNVPTRSQFRRWVRGALEQDARVTIRVVGQAEARTLNRSFRGRDYATNVLTFVLRAEPPCEGDVAICAAVVAREAREQGKTLAAHYAHLTVHGILHLQGYDHERSADARVMERRETEIVTGFGYPDPYAERGARPTRAAPKAKARSSYVRPRRPCQ